MQTTRIIRKTRLSAWLHGMLTAYLWLISCVPLGNWNAQPGLHIIPSLLAGQPFQMSDAGMLVFVSLPALLFLFAYRRNSLPFTIGALLFDFFWILLQVQSWWIPYLFGATKAWQLAYAKGPTTKVLPSFGNHVAPDAMHLVISVLLVAAMATAVAGLLQRSLSPSLRSHSTIL